MSGSRTAGRRVAALFVAVGLLGAGVLSSPAAGRTGGAGSRPPDEIATGRSATQRSDHEHDHHSDGSHLHGGGFRHKGLHSHEAGDQRERPQRGVVFDGLVPGSRRCSSGYAFESPGLGGLCTHGPDAAPPHVESVQAAVPPLTSAQIAAAPPLVCDGDGTTGRRAQAIYAVAADRPDRYSTYLASIRVWAAQVQDEFRRSAAKTGGDLALRWVHTPTAADGTCTLTVDKVILSPTGDDNFNNTINELKALGYTNSKRKYSIWVDAEVYCGIGTIYNDDRADPAVNYNNVGGASYARSDSGCWGWAETHELAHNLGAVQLSAPHTTASWHCNDDYDRMCYADGGSRSSLYVDSRCSNSTNERLLDCNNDDYFHTAPPPGSYLDNYWNTADSSFLFVPRTPLPNNPPTASITSPASGSVVAGVVTVTGGSSDDRGVRQVTVRFGALSKTVVPSADGGWSATFDSTTQADGTVTIAAVATDVDGADSDTATRSVTVDNVVTTTTDTYTGTLSRSQRSATYGFTAAPGPVSVVLAEGTVAAEGGRPRTAEGKPSSSTWTLELRTASDTVVQRVSGPAVLRLEATVAAGAHTVVVKGPQRTYSVSITYRT